jgi:hypothetical protein
MTTDAKTEKNGNGERRFQSIMLGLLTLLTSWSFTSLIQSGKDISSIQTQLVQLTTDRSNLQATVNQRGLEQAVLRADVDNLTRQVSELQLKKR